jgi:AraC-like DNA-binding protein
MFSEYIFNLWSSYAILPAMVTKFTFDELKEKRKFDALDAARTWDLKRHGWRVHATGGSQHVIGDTTYWWHGEERGGNSEHPFVIVQFTLSGWGYFEQDNKRHKIGAGNGFIAVVPSDHIYYLPEASPDWRFLWLDIWHPYAVARLTALRDQIGPSITVASDFPVMQRMIDILERLTFGLYPDDYVLEEEVLGFVVALEREMIQHRYPTAERDAWLKEIRDLTLMRLAEPPSVDELARHFRQSRTRFSHLFKNTTGLTPAQFVDSVRLSAAASQLESGSEKLEFIARATGYQSATQFCKAFRKIYALTPGAYRAYYRRDTSK